MKIIKYIWIITGLLLFGTACENDLDIAPVDQNTSAGFYNNASDIEAAVNAIYGGLQRTGLYGYNYHFLLETRSDNTFEEEPSNSGGFGDVDLFNRVTTNGVFSRTWEDSYVTIQAANIVLNRIDGIDDIDSEIRSSRKGEAKFVRALIYYNLVNLYGDVPLVIEETTNPTDFFGQGRTPVSEVYNQIITDLTEAQSELPSNNEDGRATKDAANALLGKVYLTNGNPQAAETALRAVSSATFVENYTDIFGINNENGPESIFEIQFQSSVNGNSEGSDFAALFTSQANPGSRGNNVITEDLINSFEPGDLRRNEIIPDASTPTVFISTKYVDNDLPVLDDGDNNVIVLRYADVLLMLAEALNAQGYIPDGEAFNLLNQIRIRAGLAVLDSTTITNQEEFEVALLQERRHELFMECHRWLDLKRLGDPITTMNNHFASIPGLNITIDENDLLLPIPQNQVDTDPEFITQNPGY
ncbi:RagB/SusD family nutrient uptake outer membrane protein [Maribacter sp. 4U21]|uniref:RagB/SusD family nutrient uptake outer membrane protein n=1 Tax=Maribacter sp. 4U21 TaxID=1889779 RepID=UPI000C144C1B|nr:RagB/SusD family nutrient uptake outer membrane protein [Maribacter sp. 4U21]